MSEQQGAIQGQPKVDSESCPADTLKQAVKAGRHCDLGGASIAASVISDIVSCGGEEAAPAGIRLSNAYIHGRLELAHTKVTFPLELTNSIIHGGLSLECAHLDHGFSFRESRFDRSVNLTGAVVVGQIDLAGSVVRSSDGDGDSIIADSLVVNGSVDLSERLSAVGAVRLIGATITGQLDMSGSVLLGTDRNGNSLHADGLTVGRGASFDDVTSAGAMRFLGASVSGQFSICRTVIRGTDDHGDGLLIEGIVVHGDANLRHLRILRGALRLSGGEIFGILSLGGTSIGGETLEGLSILAEDLQVHSSSLFDSGMRTSGAVSIARTQVSKQVSLRGAQVGGVTAHGTSLNANRIEVGGSLLLDAEGPARRGFETVGGLDFSGAKIRGQFRMDLQASARPSAGRAAVILDHASIGERLHLGHWQENELHDTQLDEESLAQKVPLVSMESCTYRTFSLSTDSARRKLRLLRTETPDYQPEAYQQLAGMYRLSGHDGEARSVLMAQQEHRRAVGLRPGSDAKTSERLTLWLSRAGLQFWRISLGYGYRASRALFWLFGMLAVAIGIVAFAAHFPAFPGEPISPIAYHLSVGASSGAVRQYCSIGEATGLAFRIAIPLISNVGQGSCVIDTQSALGSLIIVLSVGLQALAWIIGGLTVAAAATAIRRSS